MNLLYALLSVFVLNAVASPVPGYEPALPVVHPDTKESCDLDLKHTEEVEKAWHGYFLPPDDTEDSEIGGGVFQAEELEERAEKEEAELLASLAVANDAGSLVKHLSFLKLLKNSPPKWGGHERQEVHGLNRNWLKCAYQPVINPYQNFMINLPCL